jgi:hypothetical protein
MPGLAEAVGEDERRHRGVAARLDRERHAIRAVERDALGLE